MLFAFLLGFVNSQYIHEVLIITAGNPMDEVNEPDFIYYGMTQADINKGILIIKLIKIIRLVI